MFVEERMYTLQPGTAPEKTRILKCAPFFVERLKAMLAAVKK